MIVIVLECSGFFLKKVVCVSLCILLILTKNNDFYWFYAGELMVVESVGNEHYIIP